jgi:hypothetical protein
MSRHCVVVLCHFVSFGDAVLVAWTGGVVRPVEVAEDDPVAVDDFDGLVVVDNVDELSLASASDIDQAAAHGHTPG